MSGKRSDTGSKAINGLVGMAAAYGARKLLNLAWKQITGKEPPDHPEDPKVGLGEAIVWGIVVGAGVHTARMLASRAAFRRLHGEHQEPTEPG
jgi:Protein of unknown function (DUF4235)